MRIRGSMYADESRAENTVRPMTAGRHRPPQDTISSNLLKFLLYV